MLNILIKLGGLSPPSPTTARLSVLTSYNTRILVVTVHSITLSATRSSLTAASWRANSQVGFPARRSLAHQSFVSCSSNKITQQTQLLYYFQISCESWSFHSILIISLNFQIKKCRCDSDAEDVCTGSERSRLAELRLRSVSCACPNCPLFSSITARLHSLFQLHAPIQCVLDRYCRLVLTI